MKNESEFIKYLEKENNSSQATCKAYVADVREFERYLSDNGKWITVCESDDVKNFLFKLRNEKKSPSTINRKMVSIRSYYEFLRISGEIDSNPCHRVKVPKAEKKGPEFLTIEQIEALLAQPDDSAKGKRDKALLELMYACGLKASEVCDINIQDVDLRIGFVSCRGERTKARIIPMGKPARAAVMDYLKNSRTELLAAKKDTGALFLNYNGERITRQGVWKIIRYYGEKAGISRNLNPQMIRNSFAAHMIMNGADLKSLQELLGHEDIAATKIFLSLAKARVMDVYDKTHPRA